MENKILSINLTKSYTAYLIPQVIVDLFEDFAHKDIIDLMYIYINTKKKIRDG